MALGGRHCFMAGRALIRLRGQLIPPTPGARPIVPPCIPRGTVSSVSASTPLPDLRHVSGVRLVPKSGSQSGYRLAHTRGVPGSNLVSAVVDFIGARQESGYFSGHGVTCWPWASSVMSTRTGRGGTATLPLVRSTPASQFATWLRETSSMRAASSCVSRSCVRHRLNAVSFMMLG